MDEQKITKKFAATDTKKKEAVCEAASCQSTIAIIV
jgi:hypothetical protein